MENPKLKVYLCHDHFERLCKDSVCDDCPSKLEHKDAVMSLAALNEAEDDRIQTALATEIRSVRRALQEIANTTHKLETAVLGDGNGDSGLKTRVALIEHDLKKSNSYVGHWIAAVGIVVALGALLVAIIK